jgi:hypothetical protein
LAGRTWRVPWSVAEAGRIFRVVLVRGISVGKKGGEVRVVGAERSSSEWDGEGTMSEA